MSRHNGRNSTRSLGSRQQFDIPLHSTPAPMPSFDEVLASFRTPAIDAGEEIAWPEETAALLITLIHLCNFSARDSFPSSLPHHSSPVPLMRWLPQLVRSLLSHHDQPIKSEPAPVFDQPVEDTQPIGTQLIKQWLAQMGLNLLPALMLLCRSMKMCRRMRNNLETEASALKNLVAQLREAVSVIEAQRGEFQGFSGWFKGCS